MAVKFDWRNDVKPNRTNSIHQRRQIWKVKNQITKMRLKIETEKKTEYELTGRRNMNVERKKYNGISKKRRKRWQMIAARISFSRTEKYFTNALTLKIIYRTLEWAIDRTEMKRYKKRGMEKCKVNTSK